MQQLLPPSPTDQGAPAGAAAPGAPGQDRLLSLLLEPFPQWEATLAGIADCFRLEGCGVLTWMPDGESRALHYYSHAQRGAGAAPVLGRHFPWTRDNLVNGNTVFFSTPLQLPQAAAVDRASFEANGISSFLAIPIETENSGDFFIAHHPRSAEVWRKETVSLLRLVGEMIAASMRRGEEQAGADTRRRFEKLRAEGSGRLINVTSQEVDREVNATLKQVRELLGFDRFVLLAFSPDKREVRVTHACYGEGIAPVAEKKDVATLFPWARKTLLTGEMVRFAALDELPDEAAPDRKSWQAEGVKSNLVIPVHVEGSLCYLLVASAVRASRSIDPLLLPGLRLLGELLVNALVRCGAAAAQEKAREEIRRLEEKLLCETEHLQLEMMSSTCHQEIIGESPALARALTLTEQVAPTDSTVLITGETGTGKELIAQAIHKLGMRRNRVMVKVNCASLPTALVESELFGREKGAYTGALTRQAGRFELADGGTIFLDEIAEMSLELQAKLLRVLQEGEFERLGSARTIQVDVRVIAATNRNLAEEVAKGNFREDLYYRLNVFQIEVPPLRERVEDIPLLVWRFVQELSEKMAKKINKISRQDMAALKSYHWPGNVRELRNVVEHAVIVSNGETLQVRLPGNGQKESSRQKTLEEYEIMHIRDALKLANWRIKGEGGAARFLGINPSTLYSRMQKYGICSRPGRDDISP